MSQTANIQQLFASAREDQNLSPQSMQALQIIDMGANMQDALGMPAIQVQATSVILCLAIIDDSGSIRFRGNAQTVRDGQNLVREALMATTDRDGVLMAVRFLNKGDLCGFQPLEQVPLLDQHNYDPREGTPLYRETLAGLGLVVAKGQEFSDSGVPFRSIVYIVTDGKDESDNTVQARHVKPLVTDLLASEQHIVCGVGIDDTIYEEDAQHNIVFDSSGKPIISRPGTDFKKVFGEMGIPYEWIIDVKVPAQPGETREQRFARLRHQIRQAFQTVSQSAVRASQNAQTFSQTALGGFAQP